MPESSTSYLKQLDQPRSLHSQPGHEGSLDGGHEGGEGGLLLLRGRQAHACRQEAGHCNLLADVGGVRCVHECYDEALRWNGKCEEGLAQIRVPARG